MSLDGRKFLDQIYYEQREIQHLRELLEEKRLSPLPKSILPDPNKVQTSKRLDPMGDALSSAADLADTISTRVVELNRHKQTALDIIYQIDNSTYRTVLMLRYLKVTEDGKRPTWDDIARAIGHEYRYTLKLHGRALDAFNGRFCSWSNGPATPA